MIAKRIRGASHIRRKSRGFLKVLAYLEQEHKLDSAWHSPSLGSVRFAGYHMQMVARLNARVKNPMYHLALSWGIKEKPTQEQMEASVIEIVKAIGFDPNVHQWIAIAHKDAMHHHLHLVINRVSPIDFRVTQTPFDYYKLNKTVRALEERFEWVQKPGVAERRLKMDPELRQIEPSQIKEKVKRGFGWSGRPSFQEWVSVAVGEEVYRYVKGSGATWKGVHQILGRHHIRYTKTARGGVLYDAFDRELRASGGHLGRFATLPKLEARLGPFVQFKAKIDERKSYQTLVLAKEPSLLLNPLYDEFMRETELARQREAVTRSEAWRLQRESEQARRAAIKAKRKARNEEIMQTVGVLRRPLRFGSWLTETLELDKLKAVTHIEREAVRKSLGARQRIPTFRSWLSAEAKRGNDEALTLLADDRQRRYVYKHFFERVPELTRFLESVNSKTHTVEFADGRTAERAAESLLTRRGKRIQPNERDLLTLSGITDDSLVASLGAIYVAREEDNSLSAVFRTKETVNPDAVARALRQAGAGPIIVGTLPYPGFGHAVRVAPEMKIDFVGRARAYVAAHREVTRTIGDLPSMTIAADVLIAPAVPGAAQPRDIKTTTPPPKAIRRWLRPHETITGVVADVGDVGPGVSAVRTPSEIVLFRTSRAAIPGQRLVVAGDTNGLAATRPALQIDQSFPGF